MNKSDRHKAGATARHSSAGSLSAAAGAAGAAASAAGCDVQYDGVNIVGLPAARPVMRHVLDEKLQIADDGYGVAAGIQSMTVVDGSGDNGSTLRNRRARCEVWIACTGCDCP